MDTPLEQQFVGNEVPCMLIPVVDGQLLLPYATVAEIIPYQQKQIVEDQAKSAWFLGDLSWRGISVPLLSFEKITGQNESAISKQSRISILNNTGVSTQLPFLAIVTTGIPHRVRITPESLKVVKAEPRPYEIMHVDIDGGTAVIPDIASLERACVKVLNL